MSEWQASQMAPLWVESSEVIRSHASTSISCHADFHDSLTRRESEVVVLDSSDEESDSEFGDPRFASHCVPSRERIRGMHSRRKTHSPQSRERRTENQRVFIIWISEPWFAQPHSFRQGSEFREICSLECVPLYGRCGTINGTPVEISSKTEFVCWCWPWSLGATILQRNIYPRRPGNSTAEFHKWHRDVNEIAHIYDDRRTSAQVGE